MKTTVLSYCDFIINGDSPFKKITQINCSDLDKHYEFRNLINPLHLWAYLSNHLLPYFSQYEMQ